MTVFIRGNTFVFSSLTVFYFNTRYGFQSCYKMQSAIIFHFIFKGACPHFLVRILLLQKKGVAFQTLFHPPIQLIIRFFHLRLTDPLPRHLFLSGSGLCLSGKRVITFFDWHNSTNDHSPS